MIKKFIRQFKEGVYIGDFVYGANDGIVTTFAVVAGATGALLSSGVIIILGLASLMADAFSMGASNFLAIRSEKELERKKQKARGDKISQDNVAILLQHSGVTFTAFMVAGVVPLLPYLFSLPASQQFLVSSVLATIMFFVVGGVRTLITGGGFLKGGLEMLLVGGVAATVAYGIGFVVKGIFNIVV